MFRLAPVRLLLVCMALLTGKPLFAQDTPAEPAADEDGEIVVTARRQAERLLDVPVVVSAIGGETLRRYHAGDLTQIATLTPGVSVGAYRQNGGGTIAIRGISSPANQTGFEQAVSVALDGVQSSNGRLAQLGFFDVSQVEVMRGPQTLFFGKNSPAGVIAIRTNGPTRDLSAGLSASYGLVADEAVLEGFVSGPLNDSVSARLAIRARDMRGYLRNTARPLTSPFYSQAGGAPAAAALLPGALDPRPDEQELLGRLTLTIAPAGNFTATLRLAGAWTRDDGPGVATQNIGFCTGPNPRVAGIPDPNAECVPDNRTTVGDLPPVVAATFRGLDVADGRARGRLTAQLLSLATEWQPGQVTVAALTGYNRIGYNSFSGLDQTTFSQLAQVEKLRATELSQELRATTRFEGRINLVLGAYAQRTTLSSYSDTMLSLANYRAAADRYTSFETEARQHGGTWSLFGQLRWDITTELELTWGLRWTRETKDYDKHNLYGIGPFATAATAFPGSALIGHLQGRFRDTNLSPEITLSWRPTRDHILFAAYRTGFKSGGFGLTNPLQTTTRINAVDFASEEAKGYELGGRGIFLGGRLRLSGALFAYDFRNLQVNTYDPAAIAFTINNAGLLRQRGLELEGNWRLAPRFSLHGALAFVHNRFRDFTGQCYAYAFPAGTTRATAVPPPGCSFVNATALTLQQVYDGRAPARSPGLTGTLGFLASAPLAGGALSLSGDAYYSSSYYAADTLSPPSRQAGFWRFNASLAFAPADERWRISLSGRNLTDRTWLLYAADRTGGAGVPGAIGEQRGVVARGREVMLEVGWQL